MRILIFNWMDIKNPGAGGAEVFTHENAKRWVEKGHDVVWFTKSFIGCQKEEVIDGIRIIRDGGKYSVYWKAREHYRKRFSKEGFDVIIDETNTRPFFAKNFAKDEKVLFFIHQLAREWWFYQTRFPMNLAGYFLENRWLRAYRNYPAITVSNSTKGDLLSLGFKDIRIVSEGINFKPLEKLPKKTAFPSICFLGRMKKGKRPHLLLEAFEDVKIAFSDAELWFIGSGEMNSELGKRDVDGIKFMGRVSEKEKIDLLSKSWIQVNPSIREGWGINVIEGNACGAPCIAFDVHGLRDSIVDGKTGILVKENGDPEKLAEAIIKVLEDGKLREKLSKNSLKWSKRFTWDKSAEEFLEVLKKIVDE